MEDKTLKIICEIISFILIWSAVHYGRKVESKIEINKSNFWICLFLISLGFIIYKKYGI